MTASPTKPKSGNHLTQTAKENTMTSIFIVRAEDRGAPESIIYGVYPTVALAEARCAVLEDSRQDFCHDFVWYDEVKVGPNGADCEFANR